MLDSSSVYIHTYAADQMFSNNDKVVRYLGYYVYSSFTIRCNSILKPTWTKNNKGIPPAKISSNYEIAITQATEKDKGTYTCSGITKYGTKVSEEIIVMIGGGNVALPIVLLPHVKSSLDVSIFS